MVHSQLYCQTMLCYIRQTHTKRLPTSHLMYFTRSSATEILLKTQITVQEEGKSLAKRNA